MTAIIYVVAVAMLVACEAKIEIPGLENYQKCTKKDEACVKLGFDQINRAISTPFPKYNISGFDPIVLPHFVVDQSQVYQIVVEYKDLKITGFGQTKTLDIKEKDDGEIQETFQHSIKLEAFMKVIFQITPEVVKEGLISGEHVDVITTYAYNTQKAERNGQYFLELSGERILNVQVSSIPVLNKEQHAIFVSHPDTQGLIKKTLNNAVDFYGNFVTEMVKSVSIQFFKDKRNFFKNVPISELFIM